MKPKQKCVICGKELVYFRMVLMMGPKGFRRYACCDKCADKTERKMAPKNPSPPKSMKIIIHMVKEKRGA